MPEDSWKVIWRKMNSNWNKYQMCNWVQRHVTIELTFTFLYTGEPHRSVTGRIGTLELRHSAARIRSRWLQPESILFGVEHRSRCRSGRSMQDFHMVVRWKGRERVYMRMKRLYTRWVPWSNLWSRPKDLKTKRQFPTISTRTFRTGIYRI